MNALRIVSRVMTLVSVALISSLLVSCSSNSKNEKLPDNNKAELEGIVVKQKPYKTTYVLNEALNLEGLQVYGIYKDESQKPLIVTSKDITGFDSSKVAKDLVLTVTVDKHTAEFTVDVIGVQVEKGVLIKYQGGEMDKLVLPNSVKEIGKKAFCGANIKEVVLPEGIERIGEEAFLDCAVEVINFPSSLKEIAKESFYRAKLVTVDLSATNLTHLNDGTFTLIKTLKEVKLPVTLKSIGAQVFMATTNLSVINFPEGLEEIEIEAFRESGMVDIKLPNSLRYIGERAFYIMPNLKRVTTFGTKITPYSAEDKNYIYHYCFASSKELEHFEIPLSIRHIGQGVFVGNDKVKKLTIHKNIESIHFSAFGYTGGVREVVVEPTVPPRVVNSDTAWYGFPDNVSVVYVPSGTIDVYKKAKGWSEFENKFKEQ